MEWGINSMLHNQEINKHINKLKDKNPHQKSLRYTIWIYFLILIVFIILLIWLVQVVFLQGSYQALKTRDIKRVAQTILNATDDPYYNREVLKLTAYNNNMCIDIVDPFGNSVYSVDLMDGGCDLHGITGRFNIKRYISEISKTKNGLIYYRLSNNSLVKNKTLLFGMRIGSSEDPQGYIFLNTSLAPLDSTISILQEQMVYLTIVILIVGSIISFYMAKRISSPIVKITKSAESLAHGDYNINFDGKGYDEAEKLASTLNYASTEISKVDNLRRDLIANISHDLRTPLTMVKAYAEMIRDLSGDNPQKRNEHINVIIDESDRLAALVNDILDLSKIESGSNKLNISEFCVTDKLDEVLDRYKLLSEQQGYEFILSGDENVTVKADIIKIEQVLYNLINNAVNYTGDDKKIYIRQINSPKYVRIEISDTGEGISKEMLPLIFDRYYRIEKNQREVIGSGLGLSIVKAILKQHNYPFGVQTEEGKGSTFWFNIIR